ncbi:MAG: hypothetical protein LBU97_04895 [Alistipes sp.]|jgi:hypothetical protein|nr:hypothetical protein [Alistipes sp.]
MKRTFVLIALLCVALFALSGATTSARAQHNHSAQHNHIIYLDQNGNPVEEAHREHGVAAVGEGVSGEDGASGVPSGELVQRSFTGVAPRFGLAVQRGMFAEAGVSLDIYKLGYTEGSEYVSFGYRNIRPYVAGEMLVGSKLLGGGKAGAEFIMSTPVFGMAVGGDVSYLSDGLAEAVLLTPRLMLSFVYVEVFYGYNFFLHNDLTRWVGHHRFGVSMTLNRKFWRQKKEMYEDYYNSYVE